MKTLQDTTCYDVILELDETNTLLTRFAMRNWNATSFYRRLEIEISVSKSQRDQPAGDISSYRLSRSGPTILDCLIFDLKETAWDDLSNKAAIIVTLRLSRCPCEYWDTPETRESIDEMDTFMRVLTSDLRDDKEKAICDHLVTDVLDMLSPAATRTLHKLAATLSKSADKMIVRLLKHNKKA